MTWTIWIVLGIAAAFVAAGITWAVTHDEDPDTQRARYLEKVRRKIDDEKQHWKGKP